MAQWREGDRFKDASGLEYTVRYVARKELAATRDNDGIIYVFDPEDHKMTPSDEFMKWQMRNVPPLENLTSRADAEYVGKVTVGWCARVIRAGLIETLDRMYRSRDGAAKWCSPGCKPIRIVRKVRV